MTVVKINVYDAHTRKDLGPMYVSRVPGLGEQMQLVDTGDIDEPVYVVKVVRHYASSEPMGTPEVYVEAEA
jgi:hypothetical protein